MEWYDIPYSSGHAVTHCTRCGAGISAYLGRRKPSICQGCINKQNSPYNGR